MHTHRHCVHSAAARDFGPRAGAPPTSARPAAPATPPCAAGAAPASRASPAASPCPPPSARTAAGPRLPARPSAPASRNSSCSVRCCCKSLLHPGRETAESPPRNGRLTGDDGTCIPPAGWSSSGGDSRGGAGTPRSSSRLLRARGTAVGVTIEDMHDEYEDDEKDAYAKNMRRDKRKARCGYLRTAGDRTDSAAGWPTGAAPSTAAGSLVPGWRQPGCCCSPGGGLKTPAISHESPSTGRNSCCGDHGL